MILSGYTDAPSSLNGQAGSPVPLGFAGTWTTPTSTAVFGGALTTGAGDGARSYRPFATLVTSATPRKGDAAHFEDVNA